MKINNPFKSAPQPPRIDKNAISTPVPNSKQSLPLHPALQEANEAAFPPSPGLAGIGTRGQNLQRFQGSDTMPFLQGRDAAQPASLAPTNVHMQPKGSNAGPLHPQAEASRTDGKNFPTPSQVNPAWRSDNLPELGLLNKADLAHYQEADSAWKQAGYKTGRPPGLENYSVEPYIPPRDGGASGV